MLFEENGLVASEALKKIHKFEKSENKKVIYASTIGSISKLIFRPNSDYDLRGIFVENDFSLLNKNDLHNEDLIRFRIFDKNNTCNCIALWEAHAFLNFIFEPYIDSGYKYKLIKNVLWSFNSPFNYDPFGLQNSLLALIKKCISLEKEYLFQLNEINILSEKIKTIFDERSILEIIHGNLYIYWLCLYKELPPLSSFSLLNILKNRDKLELEGIIKRLKNYNFQSPDEKNLLITKIISLSNINMLRCRKLLNENPFKESKSNLKIDDLIYVLINHLPNKNY